MKKTFLPATVLLLLIFSCAQVKKSQQHAQMPNAIPVLRITNDTAATAIKISSLAVDIKVAANIATTTFDIIFYNPNDRVLEGEFEFPLADGQNIVRYALDMDGKLREGVVVEKAKARVAFENTIRRNIDPGLVEKTKGNNFRTRIYPLPAKGTRHILIAIEQTLEMVDKDFLYQLPLYAAEPFDKFSINAAVIKSDRKPVMEENGLSNFDFEKKIVTDGIQNNWLAEFYKNNFTANQIIAFTIPNSSENENTVVAENFNGQTFFYANSRIEAEYKKKKSPGAVGLLWDISSSGTNRNIEKETQLLKEYLLKLGDVTVSLIPFNIFTQGKEDFTISNGNSDVLLKRIKELQYDGGTQFGIIDLNNYSFDEVLLFSDGLGTFGKKEISFSNAPVITINSSPSADFSFLKYVALHSHGKFIDLSKTEMNTAVEEISSQSLQIVSMEYNPVEIEDMVQQVSPVQSSGLSFAGKLKAQTATVKVNLGFGNEIKISKTFTITKPESSDYNQVKRIWASMKIADLDLRYEENKAAITKLGKEFSVVTQNTSLIVLDRVEDYVEHEITPPEELQKEYFTLLKEKQLGDKDKKATAFNDALDKMHELKSWWRSNHSPAKTPPAQEEIITTINERGPSVSDSTTLLSRVQFSPPVIVADSEAQSAPPPPLMPGDSLTVNSGLGSFRSNGVSVSYSVDSSISYHYTQSGNLNVDATAVPFLRLDSNSVSGSMAASGNDGYFNFSTSNLTIADSAVNNLEEEKNAIEINGWKPDVSYLKELEKVPANERISKYFLLKKEYGGQPSFFIDAARFFIEKGDKKFGIQVLSNVAEMKLENAELMRMLANQLLEANEKELAIETFKDILKIREEDPQSYRDMALVYNETGKFNEAVELLYKVLTEPWDSRFGDVKAIAINEMNAIISAHTGAVNTSAVDNRFIYAMPVDVRIVIGWSSDNSDIDLWVTDPRNEKCDYSHNRTEIGGRLSQDITQGFGPEEFLLKKAWKGNYKIDANLFGDSRQTLGGPIAIKAELFTNFGKPSQKREIINFRVTSNKEVVRIGSLKFGS